MPNQQTSPRRGPPMTPPPSTSGSHRPTAIVLGTLLILGVVTSLVSSGLVDPIVEGSDGSAAIAAHEGRVLTGAFLHLLTALGTVAIAITMYSLLVRRSPSLAAGAVGFRSIEAVFSAISALGLLVLITLSREAANSDAASVSTIEALIASTRHSANFVMSVICYSLGAFAYYTVFYRWRLIPRWLSVWGLIGVAIILTTAIVVVLFGGPPFALTGSMRLLAVPIATQEIVLALWLIVKGFDLDSPQRLRPRSDATTGPVP